MPALLRWLVKLALVSPTRILPNTKGYGKLQAVH